MWYEALASVVMWLSVGLALLAVGAWVCMERLYAKEVAWLQGEVLRAREDGRLLTTRITELQMVGMQWVDNSLDSEVEVDGDSPF